MAGRRRSDVDTTKYTGKLAARLRELREAKGMTMEKLAEKAGVSVMTIYAWESNRRAIDPNSYPALAKALGCKTPDEFFPPLK